MDVAGAMEKALEEKWHQEVDRFADEFGEPVRKRPQSAMSSPSSGPEKLVEKGLAVNKAARVGCRFGECRTRPR